MSAKNSNGGTKKRTNGPHAVAATLCAMLFVLVGCEPSVRTVEHTTDQTELARMALEAGNSNVCKAAVEKLTDQALLAKVALETQREMICHAAAERLTDETFSAKFVLEAVPWQFREREAVLMKLTNQTVLAKIALEAGSERFHYYYTGENEEIKDFYTRFPSAIVGRLNDQKLLAKIALEAKDERICRAAAGKVTDQAVLAEIGMWLEPQLTSLDFHGTELT